jgi:hydroxyacylglutathione hydrolase
MGGVVLAEPLVVPLVDVGLGNSAYLVDLGDGRALVVDVSRDLRAIRSAAQARGLKVAYAADSHLHADFLSGARQLAATDGTTVLASTAGQRAFPHTGLVDGDEVDLGGLRLRALTTPGHTEEHLAFLLLDGDTPLGVFTGGSLIVGSAARTDLVDPARTEEFARAQYQRLMTLDDDVAVWPTHGAGSFCSAPPGQERISTIGAQRATNPLLAAPDEDAFVAALLGSLGSYPPYFRRLGRINQQGPAVLPDTLGLPRLSGLQATGLLGDGAVLIDTRPVTEFAAGHVTGSLSIPLRDVFATWLGWLAPTDQPLLVLRGGDQDPAEIAWQAAKVGYDNLVGELDGGLIAAVEAGLPVSATRLVTADAATGTAQVLDVRQHSEFTTGHLPGARNVELGDLAGTTTNIASGPVLVMCGHGERALTGASLLERAGHTDVAVLLGGPDDWAATHRAALETGA